MVKTCNRQYEPLIAALIHAHWGAAPARLQPIPTYPDSIVYAIDSSAGPLIFKAMDPLGRDRDGIALEAWTCERVRQAGIPAPEVLLLDTSQQVFPSSYYVMRQAEGQSLASLALSGDATRPLVRQVGVYLRQLHAIKVAGFGWLDEPRYLTDGTIQGEHATWRAFALHDLDRHLDALRAAGALDPAQYTRIPALIAPHTAVLDQVDQGSLLHGDLDAMHVWVDSTQRQITSLVDFGERKAGDPIWDLVEYDWTDRAALLDGYGLAADQHEAFFQRYYLYALLRAIPWAHRWYALGGEPIKRWLHFTLTEAEQHLR